MHDEREHPHNIRAETIPGKKEKSLSGALIGPNTRETIQWVRPAGAVSLLSQTQLPAGTSLCRSPTRGEERGLCSTSKKTPLRPKAGAPAWLSLHGTTVNCLELLS